LRELALHVLDIAENSIAASASLVEIEVATDEKVLTITVTDNGKGMDEEMQKRVAEPWATTRKTRNIGLGLPFWKLAAEMAGGAFSIRSKLGEGTRVKASFLVDCVDRAPMGDLAATIAALMAAENTDFVLRYSRKGEGFVFDTRELKAAGIDVTRPAAIKLIRDMIRENIIITDGGTVL